MIPQQPTPLQMVPDHVLLESIGSEFPVESQTSRSDKLVLLKLRELLRARPGYAYVEIGSYLGGSLTPFVKDPDCAHILSIDERGRLVPDERATLVDYSRITSKTMLDNLARHSLPVVKIETFDGSVSRYSDLARKYDLMFIDGEHTDWACFRDFIHGFKLLNDTAIVAFHDSSLIYKSLRIIQEYLAAADKEFRFVKVRDSEMSFVLLGEFCSLAVENVFAVEDDLSRYYGECENRMFRTNLSARMSTVAVARELFMRFYRELPMGKARSPQAP